jgi:tRNA threonylcarbamoyladenosine biosynthesis protein TsaB
MSVLLAIETSTAMGSLALRRNGVTIYTAEFASQRTHNSVLFAPLAEALELASDLEQIIVGTGPGSYTGVRVGIAAALGISMAREIPVCGANSLTALAVPEMCYHVVGDARRGSWHLSSIKAGTVPDPPQLGSVEEVREWLSHISGPLYAADASVATALQIPLARPSAASLAQRVEGWSEKDWTTARNRALEPIYLSDPFITTPRSAASPPHSSFSVAE